MNALEPPPSSGFFLWVTSSPAQVYAYLQAVYRLSRLKIVVKTSTGYGFVKQADGSYNYKGATEHDLALMRASCSLPTLRSISRRMICG